jgi:hypothetical protein
MGKHDGTVLRVVATQDGKWGVRADDYWVTTGLSNEEAWREVDRINGEALNRSQSVSEWLWQNSLRN